MSHNKMLIDATHPEETRVVVLRNGRVEEFDYESAARRLLRGSIYLAKITRVEPSLQAAFVDYGGNRHGFLAFNEIHPDYYQIPHSDRQALLEEEEAEHRQDEEEVDAETAAISDESDNDEDEEAGDSSDYDVDDLRADAAEDFDPEASAIDVTHLLPPEPADDELERAENAPEASRADDSETANEPDRDAPPKYMAAQATGDDRIVSEIVSPETLGEPNQEAVTLADKETDDAPASGGAVGAEPVEVEETDRADDADAVEVRVRDTEESADNERRGRRSRRQRSRRRDEPEAGDAEDEQIEDVGNADALEELPQRRRRRARSYKIQEVIKRRQIVLIQVVKEERGNKGAALTTYLSLAGRYTVLMPNTARGGGISRKITNLQDRKRLKAIAQELEVPEGMGLIIRTAGASRTKQEIKRDFEYLLRLWENVRDLTLQSTAPSLVYEEGDLIKRSIRDLYSKDIDQIVVAGEDAHKEAKSFMRMLMPSHAKNVIKYEEPHPLFAKYGIESQLNAMFSPFVQLKSGGYLVINQTEALVAVDVNSGKSTKEFSIEETALNTNLEAAEELSRQLKLRDLAGLIVVDFIDMDEKRNNRAVERKLKECLRADRARIQVGRISHFGLLEMSRQRLRTGVLEGSTMQCPHCQGTGTIRSTESVALAVLRSLEDTLMGGQPRSLVATTAPNVALYLLNNKRHFIQDMEQRYGVIIHVQASDAQQGANFTIDRLQVAPGMETMRRREDSAAVSMDTGFEPDAPEEDVVERQPEQEEGDERRSRRRRRRRRRDEDESSSVDAERLTERVATDESEDAEVAAAVETQGEEEEGDERSGRRRPRRRGRRGGRRNRDQRSEGDEATATGVAEPGAPQPDIGLGGAREKVHADAEIQVGEVVRIEITTEGEATAENVVAASSLEPAQPMDAAEDAQTEARVADETPSSAATAAVPEAMPVVASPPSAGAPQVDSIVPAEPAGVEEPRVDSPPADTSNGAAEKNGGTQATQSLDEVPPEAEPQVRDEPPVGEAGPAPRRSPGASPIASEPRLERVLVRPDQAAAANEAAKDAEEPSEKPAQKKGWWQRRFGS
jgi:ribonuclease E